MFRFLIGPNVVSLGQLEKICLDHSQLPDDLDQPYIPIHVVHVDESDEDDNYFRFLFTTRRLVQLLKSSRVLHTDATYKVNFPYNKIYFSNLVLICV